MASDPKNPIISIVEAFLVGSSSLEKEISVMNGLISTWKKAIAWNHEKPLRDENENSRYRAQLRKELLCQQSRRVTLLCWREDLLNMTALFYSTGVPLLQWRSTSTVALWLMQLWSGIPVHGGWYYIAFLPWHTTCTVIFHFDICIPLLHLHATFTVGFHFCSDSPSYNGIVADAVLKWRSIFAALHNVSFVET